MKYKLLDCKRCGFIESKNLNCPICKRRAKFVKRIKLKEPKRKLVDDKSIKKDDLGVLILTRNSDNGLYNIEYTESDIMGLWDLTFDEIVNLRKQITREKKRRMRSKKK